MRGNVKVELPYWLRPEYLFTGAEGEGGESSEGGSGDSVEDEESEEGESGDAEKGGGSTEGKEEDLSNLKSALAKERQDRKRFEKELKKLQKRDADAELDKKGEVEKLAAQLQKSQDALGKFGPKFLQRAINDAIRDAATDSKLLGGKVFADVTDALALVDRQDLDYEQDEDDPSEVEIDVKSVQAAVKALAEKKKHLLTGDIDTEEEEERPPSHQPPSGSRFNGKKKKNEADEAALKLRYPSL